MQEYRFSRPVARARAIVLALAASAAVIAVVPAGARPEHLTSGDDLLSVAPEPPYEVNTPAPEPTADQGIAAALAAPASETPASTAPVIPAAELVGTAGCPLLIESALGLPGCMISFCESGWNPNATGGVGEKGWFQIHPGWHDDATYDPAGNVAAAVRVSKGGTDWGPWSVRNVLNTHVCPSGVPYPGG